MAEGMSAMKTCRLKRRMSVTELAKRAGVCISTLYHAEQGISDMRLENLIACADVLDVSLDEYTGRVSAG